MKTTRKIIKVGNSAGIILPKGVLARLGAEAGGRLEYHSGPGWIEILGKKPTMPASRATS